MLRKHTKSRNMKILKNQLAVHKNDLRELTENMYCVASGTSTAAETWVYSTLQRTLLHACVKRHARNVLLYQATGVLLCVAVCCSVLQRVAACCSVL